MLTGDKMTTAKEIATMCRLTNQGDNTLTVSCLVPDNAPDDESSIVNIDEGSKRQSMVDADAISSDSFAVQLSKACDTVDKFERQTKEQMMVPEVFVVIDSATLRTVM